MSWLRRVAGGGLAAGLVVLAGCGDGIRYARVSGVVKLDGKPYPEAVVVFQPVGTKDNPNPGRGSSANTGPDGRYVLKTETGQEGAVVGRHLIRIMTRGELATGHDPSVGSDDHTDPKGRKVDPIPNEWNALSTKEFEVSAGGTEAADFDITSAPKKGKGKR